MKKIVFFVFSICSIASAEDIVEFRLATSQYGLVDWMRVFRSKIATDLYYIRVPGNNELNACGGYALPKFHGLDLIPFACATSAKEDREFGFKFPVSGLYHAGAYKADIYFAHFVPLRGDVVSYDILDSGNFTRGVGKLIDEDIWRWEIGASTNFFHQDGAWNPLIGPLLRRNDKHGFWAVSFLSGVSQEVRFIRLFKFKKAEH